MVEHKEEPHVCFGRKEDHNQTQRGKKAALRRCRKLRRRTAACQGRRNLRRIVLNEVEAKKPHNILPSPCGKRGVRTQLRRASTHRQMRHDTSTKKIKHQLSNIIGRVATESPLFETADARSDTHTCACAPVTRQTGPSSEPVHVWGTHRHHHNTANSNTRKQTERKR